MEQFKKMWDTMSAAQRLSIGVAAAAFVAGLMWLSSWKHESGFKPLFHGMASTEAAEAVQKLKETGVEFRLADNGATILVPEGRLDETRLALARAGLPKSGRLGFELLDAQNLGTTDFAEQINYRRALEGELERTIATISEVERARVHLTFAKDSVFTESSQPAKASVLLNLRRSRDLSAGNVIAIANLVAGAVEGLAPNQITIVDSDGELLNKPRGSRESASVPSDQLEYRAAMERDLQSKLMQTLDPVLGSGKYRAGVSVDVDFSSVQESEEKWDPNNSVMVSSQRTEESNTSQSANGGIPGTQANSPESAPRPVSTNGVTRKTESTNYQTSRSVRHIDQQKGAVKRITVAVLLDQEGKWQGSGAEASLVLTPPAPETIEVIRNLVTNVAGLNTERGDQITVDTLPFSGTKQQEPPSAAAPAPPPATVKPPSLQDQLKDPKILGAIGGGLALLIGIVVFLLKRGKKAKVAQEAAAPQIVSGAGASAAALSGTETITGDDLARLEQSLLESLRLQPKSISKGDTLAKYLRQEVKQNPQAAAQMLRTWLLEEGHSS